METLGERLLAIRQGSELTKFQNMLKLYLQSFDSQITRGNVTPSVLVSVEDHQFFVVDFPVNHEEQYEKIMGDLSAIQKITLSVSEEPANVGTPEAPNMKYILVPEPVEIELPEEEAPPPEDPN